MNKINNFQQKVAKHITEKGFNCIIQPKSFPNIVAWKFFEDKDGSSLAINAHVVINGKEKKKIYYPFFITMIECRLDNPLNKKEIKLSKQILKEGRCNAFFVAYEDKKELQFKEIENKCVVPTLDIKENVSPKDIKETTHSYIG